MRRSSHRLAVCAAALVLTTSALGLAPTAFGDDWARDRIAVAQAVEELDPAIRAAVIVRASETPATPSVVVATPTLEEGFAWGAAAVGLGTGIAGMCVLFACVTLVRSHGRLRSV